MSPSVRPSSKPTSAKAPNATLRVQVFVLVALAVQLLVPLRYYLSSDKYDERFSWRMFSSTRLQDCRIAPSDQRGEVWSPIDLRRTMQEAWTAAFSRQRVDAIEKFLRSRCVLDGVTAARMQSQCTSVEGVALPARVYEVDCATRDFSEREDP